MLKDSQYYLDLNNKFVANLNIKDQEKLAKGFQLLVKVARKYKKHWLSDVPVCKTRATLIKAFRGYLTLAAEAQEMKQIDAILALCPEGKETSFDNVLLAAHAKVLADIEKRKLRSPSQQRLRSRQIET